MKSQDHGQYHNFSGLECRVVTITSVINLNFLYFQTEITRKKSLSKEIRKFL